MGSRELIALVIVPAVLSAGLALVIAGAQKTRFQASAAFVLADPAAKPQESGGPANLSPLLTPDQREAAALEDFKRPLVLAQVSQLLGGRPSSRQIDGAFDVTPRGINGVFQVTAHGANADFVARLANAAVQAESLVGGAPIRSTYRRAATGAQIGLREAAANHADVLTLVQNAELIATLQELEAASTPIRELIPATPPRHPVAPKPLRDALLAGGVGLLLGGLLALSRLQLGKSEEEKAVREMRAAGRVIGTVPPHLLGAVVRADSPKSRTDDREVYRIIRANVDFLHEPAPRSVSVTGARPGAGTSGVAASLALAAAASGRRTLLIDADLGGPRSRSRLGQADGEGLAEVLLGRAVLPQSLRDCSWGERSQLPPRSGSLFVLPAGEAREEAIVEFSAERMEQLLAEAIDSYEFVVLDTPPALSAALPLSICASTDAVLLCLLVGREHFKDVEHVERTLGRLGSGPVAHVLTGG